MQKTDLCIEILGTRIVIAAEEDPVYLKEVLALFQSHIADTKRRTGLDDPLKVAILTGYQLCDEIKKLSRLQRIMENEGEAAAKKLQDIMFTIDAGFTGEIV